MENSMFTDVYFVPKASGTYADVFMAYGFARLMERLLLEVKRGDPTAQSGLVLRMQVLTL